MAGASTIITHRGGFMEGSNATIVDGKLVIKQPDGSEGAAVLSQPEVKATAKAEKSRSQKKIRVVINPQEGSDGKFDVPLGVNGRVLLVKRGVEVAIPEEYFFVLRDAKVDQLVRNPGEEEQVITISRFSYNVLGEVN